MSRRAERGWRLAGALASLALFAGCATSPASRVPLSPEAEAAWLQGLERFTLTGKAGVRAGVEGEKGCNCSVNWQQRGDEASLRLSGPLGAGSLRLTYRPGYLRVNGGRGEVLEGDEAVAVLTREVGFVPPFDALRYWVRGLPAPGEAPAEQKAGADGRIEELVQQQWRIRYERWNSVNTRQGRVQLPGRLTATRDDVRLRLVIERWKPQ